MQIGCEDLFEERYPWLKETIEDPLNHDDNGLLNIRALCEFCNSYTDAKNERVRGTFNGALVVVTRVIEPWPLTEEEHTFDNLFYEINHSTRCLDLCFKYDRDTLVMVSGACVSPLVLEKITKRIRAIVATYGYTAKVAVGRPSDSESESESFSDVVARLIEAAY